jgi:antirestriction protein ArdC
MATTTTTRTDVPNFVDLLEKAVTEPGTISAAYFAFHGYSLGNQLLALFQCEARGMQPGPIASFHGWKDRGRYVRKGEKAIELCMPVTCTRRQDEAVSPDTPEQNAQTFTRFIYRRNWFVLSQTDGAPYQAPTVPDWNRARALKALDVNEQPFTMLDGNCQGYAKGRAIAVSPIASNPIKTTFHELAHVLIGHTVEAELRDDERTPRDIREVEAEATAMLVCAALNVPGIEDARGYVQHWNASGQPIPEASARKIFKAADAILRAGRQEIQGDGSESVVDDPNHRDVDR